MRDPFPERNEKSFFFFLFDMTVTPNSSWSISFDLQIWKDAIFFFRRWAEKNGLDELVLPAPFPSNPSLKLAHCVVVLSLWCVWVLFFCSGLSFYYNLHVSLFSFCWRYVCVPIVPLCLSSSHQWSVMHERRRFESRASRERENLTDPVSFHQVSSQLLVYSRSWLYTNRGSFILPQSLIDIHRWNRISAHFSLKVFLLMLGYCYCCCFCLVFLSVFFVHVFIVAFQVDDLSVGSALSILSTIGRSAAATNAAIKCRG